MQALALTAVLYLGGAACSSEQPGTAMPVTTEISSPGTSSPIAPTPKLPTPLLSQQLHNAAGEQPSALTLNSYDGDHRAVGRPGDYDYAPSVVATADGAQKMWFCGGGGSGAHKGDSIWYSENKQHGDPVAWTQPTEVIRASNDSAYLDFAHACDPTVVRQGSDYYVFYTGAADWKKNGGACDGAPTADGCDNRIFAARVAVDKVTDPASYQKLVDDGECAEPSCFQWEPFWNVVEKPPVPVIRYEQNPVWRRASTGNSGTTTQQTRAYGIGQPSAVNTSGKIRMWHTDINGEPAENLAVKSVNELADAAALQSQTTYERQASNIGNEVNYDVAYSASIGRYIVTIAEQHQNGDPLGRPRVEIANYGGEDTSAFKAPIMNNHLHEPDCNCYAGQETGTHNAGFLRDEYGNLATAPGPNGTSLNYVFYGTNAADPAKYDIGRTAFSLTR
jgi:hypothetical protein